MRGMFVVFEGIDGAGTTTQARMLGDRLRCKKDNVVITAEPTTGPVGYLIRLILSGRLGTDFDRRALALLFAADRLDHLTYEILPHLERGDTVISDRYSLSSLAYQSLDAPLDWVLEINRFAIEPDILFFLDVPPDVAYARIRDSRYTKEMFEKYEALVKIANIYNSVLSVPSISTKVVRIDGTISKEEVAEQVWEKFLAYYETRK